MNYKKVFFNKSNEELLELLEHDEGTINYSAKLSLLDLLKERKIIDEDDPRVIAIKQSLQVEEDKIKDLKYLHNMGFKIHAADGQVKIVRSGMAKFVDLLGAFLGFLLMLVFIPAFGRWREIFDTGMEIMPLVFAIVLSVIGLLGLMLFQKGAARFIDHLGFEILKDGSAIRVSRLTGFKLNKFDVAPNALFVEKNDGNVSLVCDSNDTRFALITTHGGPRFEKTIYYLKSELA
ncbi:hypothetical protein C900_00019 [Fulvivirga imtechensis AK7]|uniref:Uncharacterized protein n=1 Tax=Fulvivirga imtechensis AK7 TaxID=1237149 RepID=L8JYJ2_9BACT|nr:hypothetical protein [Fulvivirga imtechensis]ELR73855.1 hypothetical protein C900_00019 [Fulvivirga imtechensis AK7]